MVVIDRKEKWIGHRLNILGVRVADDHCQLVAKAGKDWITMGITRALPIRVPVTAEELLSAANDPLLITAYQYMAEYPDSNLARLLSKELDFDSVLNAGAVDH